MPSEKKSSRPRCERCRRPSSHCLCAHVTTVANRSRVLILQHPDEARHALNTARLAVLGLQRAELLVGETFPELDGIIAAARSAVLLFPAEDPDAHPPLTEYCGDESTLLIVPDGTWRKARRIVHANPVLSTLPRVTLAAGQASEYRVRKAAEPAAVSTIEAIVRTLVVLEPDQNFEPVLRPFHALVAQQIAAMGEEVYLRNHAGRCSAP